MSWGGKREGAGRRPNPDKRARVSVFLTDAERERFKALGGAEWLRKQLSQSQTCDTPQNGGNRVNFNPSDESGRGPGQPNGL